MSEVAMIARRIRALDWPEKDFIRWAMRSGIGDETISVVIARLRRVF